MKFENTKNELRICFVAYVDILGFRKKIEDCENDYFKLNEVLENLKTKIFNPQNQFERLITSQKGKISFFSDSIFVYLPIPSDSPESLDDGRPQICSPISDLAEYQFYLALEDIFIRGGAAVNYGYMNDKFAFGPAILNAVDCEKVADFPRICLTDETVSIVKHYIENQWPGDERIQKLVLHSNDGKYFINYLQTVVDIIEEMCENIDPDYFEFPLYRNVPLAIDYMKRHKENIQVHLKSKDPKINSKFIWLAKYHNFFSKRHFHGLVDLLISDYYDEFTFISQIKNK